MAHLTDDQSSEQDPRPLSEKPSEKYQGCLSKETAEAILKQIKEDRAAPDEILDDAWRNWEEHFSKKNSTPSNLE